MEVCALKHIPERLFLYFSYLSRSLVKAKKGAWGCQFALVGLSDSLALTEICQRDVCVQQQPTNVIFVHSVPKEPWGIHSNIRRAEHMALGS